MRKTLLIAFLTTLNACTPKTYEAIVLRAPVGLKVETMVNKYHYIIAEVNFTQADTLKIGDKVIIDALNLNVIK